MTKSLSNFDGKNFKVGMKVALVGTFHENCPLAPNMIELTMGNVYTIRDLIPPEYGFKKMEIGLRFEEVINPTNHVGMEYAYGAGAFRPVAERGTDTGMAILQKILDKYPIKVG